MNPLRDEDVISLLREDVAALDPRPASVESAVTTGRRRVRTRRAVAGVGTLAAAAVLTVAGLQLTSPDVDRSLPTDGPSVTLTEQSPQTPSPEGVYDALDARLMEMGLSTERGRWSAVQVTGIGFPPGLALGVYGEGFSLESSRWSDQAVEFDSCAYWSGVGLEYGCTATATPDGGTLSVVSRQGRTIIVEYSSAGVLVRAALLGQNPVTQAPVQPLDEDQLVAIATDPGLRWR